MTQTADSPTVELSRFGWRDLGLWAGAAALVLGAHVAVAYAVQSFNPIETDGGPPPALVIEMAPMVVTPAVPEQAAMLDAVVPDQSEPTPTTEPTPNEQVDKTDPVVEQPDTTPPDETEPTQTETAEQVDQQQPDEIIPDVAEAIAPDVVVPLPQAKPVEAPKDKKPVQAKTKKPVDKRKLKPKKEKAEPPKTTAVTSADAKAAAKTAAPKSAGAVSRSGDSKRWNSQLTAWINRHKRYPSAARARRATGTVSVAFAVDPSGQVTSVRIAGSSGDSDLDRATLDMLRGAKVPPPPEGVSSLVRVPLQYNLRD